MRNRTAAVSPFFLLNIALIKTPKFGNFVKNFIHYDKNNCIQ